MMTLGFYLDVVVAVLLVATVVFCWVLNKKLEVIRNHRAELEALIAAFNDSCLRAESGVKALRSATDEATRLQQYLERSQNLRDDLSYLVDRGGSLADRLEGGVRTARTEVGRPGAKPEGRDNVSRLPDRGEKPMDVPAAPTMGLAPEGRMDRRAAARAAFEPPAAAPAPAAAEAPEAPAAAGRAERNRPTRDRASLRQALSGGAEGGEAGGEAAPRSRAERELLQALRARR